MACLHFSSEVKYAVSEMMLLNFLKLIIKLNFSFKLYCKFTKSPAFIGLLYTYNSLFCANCYIIAQFKGVGFDPLLQEAGSNAFTLSPTKWIEQTNAIGIVCTTGRNGGTYAQRDIAFKFANWVSVEFELYLVKEFQRLKEEEQKQIGWSVKRELSKLNYRIHTDAIKQNIVPEEIDAYHKSLIYAEEADVLNVAMFGMTAKEWRDSNPDKKGNIRDYATINELICLSNMENLNAVFINDGMPQTERLVKLNQVAIQQMQVLEESENRKYLK